MVSLGLFDIEADPLDALFDIEIEHLARRRQAGGGQYRNNVKRHVVSAQQPDPDDRLVEGALPGAGQPVAIVQALRSVDADAEIHVLLGKKFTPRLVDQRSIRLE